MSCGGLWFYRTQNARYGNQPYQSSMPAALLPWPGPASVGRQSVEDVKARHKKELKALDGTGRKLVKQANKNKKKVAEAEAKIAEVGQAGAKAAAEKTGAGVQ